MRGLVMGLGVALLFAGCESQSPMQRDLGALKQELSEVRRQGAQDRIRLEDLNNRLELLKDELHRWRTAARTAATPVPGESVVAASPRRELTVARDPDAASAAGLAGGSAAPGVAPLPVVKVEPGGPAGGSAAPAVTPLAAQRHHDSRTRTGTGSARAAYTRALALYRAGERERCLELFARVARRWPRHALADNAYYWRGRALAEMGRHEEAGRALEIVVARYPAGNKVPDALAMLADLAERRGLGERALRLRRRVLERFPASEAARLTAARLREATP